MTEELETLLDVVAQLDHGGIPYMVSGSMAMNLYAEPRMTRDIDIVVELTARSAEKLSEMLEENYFVDREAAHEAAVQRRMFNAVHKQRLVKVDFVVRKDAPYREEEFRRRRLVGLENREIWFVAPEDLLLSKLYWAKDSHSELQLRDVRNLLASVPDLDGIYIDRWASVLGVEGLLDEVRK